MNQTEIKPAAPHDSVWTWCIRHRRVAVMAGILVAALGTLSTIQITKEEAPNIPYGIAVVRAAYPGAAASDVDALITQKIGDKLKTLTGVDKIEATSSQGISAITVTYFPETDLTQAISDLRSKVDEAKPDLPSDLPADPQIQQVDASLQPFILVEIWGDATRHELTDVAEALKSRMTRISEVARAEIQHGADREIRVDLDPAKLAAHAVRASEVTSVIRSAHHDFPLGNMMLDENEFTVRIAGRFAQAEEIGALPLRNTGTDGGVSILRVRDLGRVYETGDNEVLKSISNIIVPSASEPVIQSTGTPENLILPPLGRGLGGGSSAELSGSAENGTSPKDPLPEPSFPDGEGVASTDSSDHQSTDSPSSKPTVTLTLSRQSGTSIFAASEKVRAELEEFRKTLPAGIHLTARSESIDHVTESYTEVVKTGVIAIIVVTLIAFVAIGVTEGLIASLVIPLSMAATIAVLLTMGETLNFMTNFAMIMGLGILVDTAVVIVQGTHQWMRRGLNASEATTRAVEDFHAPLTAGMLTTISVFIPLLVLPGILGKYLSYIPRTMTIILALSLVIALTLIPAYAAVLLEKREPGRLGRALRQVGAWLAAKTGIPHLISRVRAIIPVHRFTGSPVHPSDSWQDRLQHAYVRVLRHAVGTRKRRALIMVATILAFTSSFFLPGKFEMFPESDQPSFSAEVKAPVGTPSEETARMAAPFAAALASHPEIRVVRTDVSGRQAGLEIELFTKVEREGRGLLSSVELVPQVRDEFDELAKQNPRVEARVSSVKMGPPSSAAVAFRLAVTGASMEEAERWVRRIEAELKKEPGTTGVRTDLELLRGEVRYRIDRERALALGIDPDAAAGTLSLALRGQTAATVTRGDRDIDVRVRYEPDAVSTLDQLGNLELQSSAGSPILVRQIAELSLHPGLANVNRRDGDVAFTISADLGGTLDARTVTASFTAKAATLGLPSGLTLTPAGEEEENAALFAALGMALAVAILAMFAILVVEFDSFGKPLLVLGTALFSQTGVNIGFALTATPKSLAYIIGTITLAGIVVNHTIILVDQIRRRADAGDDPETAAISAAGSRFEPIVLTTIMTIAGTIPLIWINSFWLGLSFTILFGLAMSFLLTLFVVPAVYIAVTRSRK